MTSENLLKPQIITVKDLLEKKHLTIPEYQRPYKWNLRHVNQLIDDILLHRKKSAYRIGTLVFHQENGGPLNIVDGQQRTITLLLIALAIHRSSGTLKEALTGSKVPTHTSEWFHSLKFTSRVTLSNIQTNYREIARRVKEFDVETVQFFYRKCELVEVTLREVSEAFQFFDSQNARGKDLEPHDLLKAFHLREMAEVSNEQERLKCVEGWENTESEQLSNLMGNYLFRVRNWSKNDNARYFTKDHIGLFKGLSARLEESFPYAQTFRISHFYVEDYNRSMHRKVSLKEMSYPFQIDQVQLNGQRFFELVDHYLKQLESLKALKDRLDDTQRAYSILEQLDSDTYSARHRTGDKYIRNLFDCCLLYYIDRFGYFEIERAIEKIFIWAYSLRLKRQNVKLAAMDNHALDAPYFFWVLREAVHPKEVLNIALSPIPKADKKSRKTEVIEKLFLEMNYLHAS